MSIDRDSPRPDMAAYISANGFDELPEEASIADKLDLRGLMGVIFFFANMLSVILEAEADVLSPRLLGRTTPSERLDNGGSSGLGIGLVMSKDEPIDRSTN
jgi:hypothetical protein